MGKETTRLSDLDVVEVSLVDRPAIKREFLVMKSDEGVDKGQPDAGDVHTNKPLRIVGKQQTKTEDGVSFGPDAFLVVPDRSKPSTWKLRIQDRSKKVTRSQLGAAAAAVGPGGFRGQRVDLSGTGSTLDSVKRRLRSEYRKLGVADEELPPVLKAQGGTMDIKELMEGLQDQVLTAKGEGDVDVSVLPMAAFEKALSEAVEAAKAEGKTEGAEEAKKAADKETDDEVAKAEAENNVLKEALAKADGRIEVLEKDAALAKARQHVTAKKWAGDVDENAEMVVTMGKSLSEEAFKAWLQREDTHAEALGKSAIFTEVGKSNGNGGSEVDALVAKSEQAAAEVRKSGGSQEDEYAAMVATFSSDPGAYDAAQDAALYKGPEN